MIVEDNVRICSIESVQRIREAKANASGEFDLIYFGWLGSIKNLTWVINCHSTKSNGATFPFPSCEDYGEDDVGGTALWGAYAYHISERCYKTITSSLKRDVGGKLTRIIGTVVVTYYNAFITCNVIVYLKGLLWKGKRMRAYLAKPIDKVMPRRVKAAGLGIEVTKKPVFFRAPMLTSRIHTRWDPEFCKSTEYQLNAQMVGLPNIWDDLWLTDAERETVTYRRKHGKW